jgi:signal transduction histidine kinase
VIERQHGSIHADNNPDKGCRFWFTLPLGPTETELDESSTSH